MCFSCSLSHNFCFPIKLQAWEEHFPLHDYCTMATRQDHLNNRVSSPDSEGVIYSAWRKLDNGTYIRVNDSLRAQDLWYASSPSSVNSSTLDAMDVIEIENGRWVFSEERGKWHWEPKAGQVCFLHNYFQQFRNHFKAIFWMLQFIFFRVKQLFLEVGRCCRTGSGFSIRPPRRPTLRRARRVGNLEVMALGIIKCQ